MRVHSPLYSAVPAWNPDECSLSSGLSQNARAVEDGSDTSSDKLSIDENELIDSVETVS